LPPQFSRFARSEKLDIINGVVLDLPNGLLQQLGADPSVFRVHDDRPVFTHNYRRRSPSARAPSRICSASPAPASVSR
jgi:hypothetical protein